MTVCDPPRTEAQDSFDESTAASFPFAARRFKPGIQIFRKGNQYSVLLRNL